MLIFFFLYNKVACIKYKFSVISKPQKIKILLSTMQIGECCKFLILMQHAQGIPVVLWILLLTVVRSVCCILWRMLCVAQDELCWILMSHSGAGLYAAPSQCIPSNSSVTNFNITRNLPLKKGLQIRVQKTPLDTLIILNCTYLCGNGDNGGDYVTNCSTGFWSLQIAVWLSVLSP